MLAIHTEYLVFAARYLLTSLTPQPTRLNKYNEPKSVREAASHSPITHEIIPCYFLFGCKNLRMK